MKLTCKLYQDTVFIKSQDICCCTCVCVVSVIKFVYVLNTQKPVPWVSIPSAAFVHTYDGDGFAPATHSTVTLLERSASIAKDVGFIILGGSTKKKNRVSSQQNYVKFTQFCTKTRK